MPEQIVADTSGIAEGDGHFLHEYPDIMANPAAKRGLEKIKSEGNYFIDKPFVRLQAIKTKMESIIVDPYDPKLDGFIISEIGDPNDSLKELNRVNDINTKYDSLCK